MAKKFLLYSGVSIGLIVLALILIRLILLGYTAGWTGFGDYTTQNPDITRGKTLWDWMELLIIPLVLAGGAYYLNHSERTLERQIAKARTEEEHALAERRSKLEREIASDRQREAALQNYLDRMAELLLEKKLRTPENEEVRRVARIRTLTVLRGLDPSRKRIVLLFLKESELITRNPVVDLSGGDLRGADLNGTDLRGNDLHGTLLQKANLTRADLSRSNLIGADLREALLYETNLSGSLLHGVNLCDTNLFTTNLSNADLFCASLIGAELGEADLSGADLREANLQEAKVKDEQLQTVKSLKGTTMPNGTKHE